MVDGELVGRLDVDEVVVVKSLDVLGLLSEFGSPAISVAPAAMVLATPFTIIVPPPGPPTTKTPAATTMVAPPLTVVVRDPVLVEVVLVADNEVDGLLVKGADVLKAVIVEGVALGDGILENGILEDVVVEDVILEDVVLEDVVLRDGRDLLFDNVVLSMEDGDTNALETRVTDEEGIAEDGGKAEDAVFVEVENDGGNDVLEDIPFEEEGLTEDDAPGVAIAPDIKDEGENEEDDFEEAIVNEAVPDGLLEAPLNVAASATVIKVPMRAKSAAAGRSMADKKWKDRSV